MKDYFSKQSDQYALYRPAYPAGLYTFLLSITEGREAAWDCGTGNGQVAADLAPHFNKIFATDISEKQLHNAIARPNIIYKPEPAEHTDFADNMFDLITVAQAIHWFDFNAFYTEVKRVIKPNGILVVIGYGLISVNESVDRIIAALYHDIVGPYWDKERRYVDDAYQTIPFPFDDLPAPAFIHTATWTMEHLAGYLETWSAVQHYIKDRGQNPVDLIRQALQDAWGHDPVQTVRFPILLRVARVNSMTV